MRWFKISYCTLLIVAMLAIAMPGLSQSLSATSKNQDTILVDKALALARLQTGLENNMALVENYKIKVPFAVQNSIFRFLTLGGISEKAIKFKKCFIGVMGENSLSYVPEAMKYKRLEFDSCILPHIVLAKQSNETAIYNSNIGVLEIDSSTELSVRLSYNTVENIITLNNCKELKLDLQNIKFASNDNNNFPNCLVANSTVSEFTFHTSEKGEARVSFRSDSITKLVGTYIQFNNSDSVFEGAPVTKFADTLTFLDCYINAFFMILPTKNPLVLEFENCTFGPNADLRELCVTGVSFRRCTFPTTNLRFGINPAYIADMTLVSTDPALLQFSFTENIKLTFSEGYSDEIRNSAYRSLLEKFQKEGRPESYRIVDLQYAKFSESALVHFLEDIWWGHGYRTGLVFWWTGGLLLLFFGVNLLWWRQMYSAYPLVPWRTRKSRSTNLKSPEFISIVFLYTIFTFFSLKVNFDKLNFKKMPFVYIFLFQYLIGIWCLLFILRYVLKL